MARAVLREHIADRAGNSLASHTIAVYQVGTTTAITDTMYSTRTGAVTLSNPLTTDSQGNIEAWFEVDGASIPGYVRLYNTTAGSVGVPDKEVAINPAPGDTMPVGAYTYHVYKEGSNYIAKPAQGSGTKYSSAAGIGTVLNNAMAAGRHFLIQDGTHTVDATIAIGTNGSVIIEGQSQTGTVLQAAAGVSPVISMGAAQRGRIRNLQVDCDDDQDGIVLTATNQTSNSYVEWVTVANCTRRGISLVGGFELHVHHCEIIPNKTGSATTGIYATSADHCIFDNSIRLFEDVGIYLGSGGHRVTHNHIVGHVRSSAIGSPLATGYPVAIYAPGGSSVDLLIAYNYIDAISQAHAIQLKPAAANSISLTRIIGNQFLCDSGFADGTGTPDADNTWSPILIDSTDGAITSAQIIGNTGKAGDSSNRWASIVKFTTHTGTGVNVANNSFLFCTLLWSTRPQLQSNNFVTRAGSTLLPSEQFTSTAGIADGATITHGLAAAPSAVIVMATTAGEIATAAAAGFGATTFVVDIKKNDNTAGTTQTIMWLAKV